VESRTRWGRKWVCLPIRAHARGRSLVLPGQARRECGEMAIHEAVKSSVVSQGRHRDCVLDERGRTAARARPRGAGRPLAMAAPAPVPRTAPRGTCNRPARPRCQRDASEYHLEREYEDIAAVVDAAAAAGGQRVDVYGHSHGGIVAFGAAALTANVRKLVVYEGWPLPDPSMYALPAGVMKQMDQLLAEGDRRGKHRPGQGRSRSGRSSATERAAAGVAGTAAHRRHS